MKILETLSQMFFLVILGGLWRYFAPGPYSVATVRQVLSEVVLDILLPALVIHVVWNASIGVESLQISLIATTGILAGVLLSSVMCHKCSLNRSRTGAVVLAASFANVTYLGLPVLVSLYGDWGAEIAIQYDLFASTPLLFSLGFYLAARYGGKQHPELHPIKSMLRLPPVWAAILAVLLNVFNVPTHPFLNDVLQLLGASVIPLMLLVLGMSLEWSSLQRDRIPGLIVVLLIQLGMMPVVVWLATTGLGISGDMKTALVLEAAMPSMLIGLVVCDRFNLDTGLYAAAVSLSTLVAFITLPFWYSLLV